MGTPVPGRGILRFGSVTGEPSPALTRLPGPDTLPEYYHGYLARLDPETGDVLEALARQGEEVLERFRGITPEAASHRYAPGKWTVREVLGHVVDTERVFQLRALWFARGDGAPLPAFDENAWAAVSNADSLPVDRLLEEYAAARNATLALYGNLDAEALERTGTASGHSFQVGALAWFLLAHERHHLDILRDRYGR